MTGWGRRSKKRPKRTDSAAATAAAATAPTLESAPTPPDESDIDSQGITEGAGGDSNNNAPYQLRAHAAAQDGDGDGGCTTPESTVRIASSPVLEPLDSLRYYPRTLVNGVYYLHDPSSLPQPLGQGYLAWASLEHEAARRSPPRRSGESRWNNRTLRFWHLSTDFSRFREDREAEGREEKEGPTRTAQAGERDANQPPTMIHRDRDSTPQRPYTAPPHQCEY